MLVPDSPAEATSDTSRHLARDPDHGITSESQIDRNDHKVRNFWGMLSLFMSETSLTIHATLTYSYINLLLFFVPLGLVAAVYEWDPTTVFIMNFFALFPLASILTFSTEQLADKIGSILGGLINATFGNALEMIVGINALREREIRIVQWSMVGSILSSILLILGSCFFFAGRGRQEVQLNKDVASLLTSLSIISSASLIIPSALQAADGSSDSERSSENMLTVSHLTCIVLLIFYLLYLYFQTWSHSRFFSDSEEQEHQDEGVYKLTMLASSIILVLTTLAVSVCSDYLVDSLGGFVQRLGISRAFIGLIIVPILGNASQFVATVQWALTNKVNLAVGLTVSSTVQISLFVTPFLVLMGWAMGKPMSLQFDTFDTVVLTMAVLVVNSLVRDGRSNYFEGCLLVGTYFIVAIAFFVKPDAPT